VFVFSAENGLFGHSRLFSFLAENEFSSFFYLFFRLRFKNVVCVGPKMLCSQLNRNCSVISAQVTFVFGRKWNIIFVGIFVYGRN